jgi:hypothetical protein
MGIAARASTRVPHEEAQTDFQPLWRESFAAIRATLPEVVRRHAEVRPLAEQVSRTHLPSLVLLAECDEA